MKQNHFSLKQTVLLPLTYGVAAGVGVCVGILLLGAMVLSLQDIPLAAIPIIATAASIAGAFIAGFVCTLLSREQGLLYGALSGGILFLMIFLASLAHNGLSFGVDGMTTLAALLFAGALGGVISANRRQKFH